MRKKVINMLYILVFLIGFLIILNSHPIVFSGLESLLGIEFLVGTESVAYNTDGSYYFTNPGAMFKWIMIVNFIGLIIVLISLLNFYKANKTKKY